MCCQKKQPWSTCCMFGQVNRCQFTFFTCLWMQGHAINRKRKHRHRENMSGVSHHSLRTLQCASVCVCARQMKTVRWYKEVYSGLLYMCVCVLPLVWKWVCMCEWHPKGRKYSHTENKEETRKRQRSKVWYFLILTSALPRWNCVWCSSVARLCLSPRRPVHEVSVVFNLISFQMWRRGRAERWLPCLACWVKLDCLSPLL